MLQVFFAQLSVEDKNIKSCMAGIYSKQMAYRETHSDFIADVNDLYLDELPECRDLKIQILESSREHFIVQVESKKQCWLIDSTKTMTRM